MRRLYCCTLLTLMLATSVCSHAQEQEGLRRNAKGRYIFTHTINVPGAQKAVLYERMKSFVVEDLDASDTHINWDEAQQDSITAIAFIDLGNSPEMMNQLVDCKAHLEFTDGQIFLRLSGFNYSAKRVGSDVSYNQPLHRMGTMPDAAQSWAMTALTETLRQIMVKMDALASGDQAIAPEPQKVSKPRGKHKRVKAH